MKRAHGAAGRRAGRRAVQSKSRRAHSQSRSEVARRTPAARARALRGRPDRAIPSGARPPLRCTWRPSRVASVGPRTPNPDHARASTRRRSSRPKPVQESSRGFVAHVSRLLPEIGGERRRLQSATCCVSARFAPRRHRRGRKMHRRCNPRRRRSWSLARGLSAVGPWRAREARGRAARRKRGVARARPRPRRSAARARGESCERCESATHPRRGSTKNAAHGARATARSIVRAPREQSPHRAFVVGDHELRFRRAAASDPGSPCRSRRSRRRSRGASPPLRSPSTPRPRGRAPSRRRRSRA